MGVSFSLAGSARDRRIDMEVGRTVVGGRAISVPSGKERDEGEVSLRAGKFPVSLYVAAAGPRSLRMAGRVTDSVILGSGFDLRALQWAKISSVPQCLSEIEQQLLKIAERVEAG